MRFKESHLFQRSLSLSGICPLDPNLPLNSKRGAKNARGTLKNRNRIDLNNTLLSAEEMIRIMEERMIRDMCDDIHVTNVNEIKSRLLKTLFEEGITLTPIPEIIGKWFRIEISNE